MAEMAELSMSAMGNLGTSAAAAGVGNGVSAVAPTIGQGGWITSTIPQASSAFSMMQGGMTAAQMLTQIGAGGSGYAEGQRKAGLADLEGQQAQLQSQERELRIRREVLQKTGAARVAFSASGVDISSGSAAAVEDDIGVQGKFETAIERGNSSQKALAAQLRAAQYRSNGENSLLAGIGKAAQTGSSFAIDIAKRG
jgi:hypothetical protein